MQAGGIFVSNSEGGGELFFMSHKQTFLINLIKMLFSCDTIEFGYIKYELGGGGAIFFNMLRQGCNF